MKKTAIIGASTNPSRYSYMAAEELTGKGHDIIPIGIKRGSVSGEEILDIREKPDVEEVDTVTMYMSARNQVDYIEYILSLNPKRIIFNPGTENPEFQKLAEDQGIEVVYGCTLVMLSVGNY